MAFSVEELSPSSFTIHQEGFSFGQRTAWNKLRMRHVEVQQVCGWRGARQLLRLRTCYSCCNCRLMMLLTLLCASCVVALLSLHLLCGTACQCCSGADHCQCGTLRSCPMALTLACWMVTPRSMGRWRA